MFYGTVMVDYYAICWHLRPTSRLFMLWNHVRYKTVIQSFHISHFTFHINIDLWVFKSWIISLTKFLWEPRILTRNVFSNKLKCGRRVIAAYIGTKSSWWTPRRVWGSFWGGRGSPFIPIEQPNIGNTPPAFLLDPTVMFGDTIRPLVWWRNLSPSSSHTTPPTNWSLTWAHKNTSVASTSP